MRLLPVALALVSCVGSGVLASPTPAPSPLPVVELKYRIFDQVGRPWYCDSDYYPVARTDETDLARERLPEMQSDPETWSAILAHNALGAGVNLTDAQLLAAYRDWKDLRALELQPTGPARVYGFSFTVRAAPNTKQAERVEGRIDTTGKVSVLSRQQAGPTNCPICLADTALIDTPRGPIVVTDLRVGDLVWTMNAFGARVAAPILMTESAPAPAGHEVLRVSLADGRVVIASPGHPTADGRPLGLLRVGDALEGAVVTAIERLPYRGRTHDLLPAGDTGAYRADGVLLGSTLGR